VRSLETGHRDPLLPQLIPKGANRRRKKSDTSPSAIVTALLGEIASRNMVRVVDLETFVSHTYSAICHGISSSEIQRSVERLEADKLIYKVENSHDTIAATRLGRTVSYSGLQAETGAMFGAFFRALISLSEKSDQQGGSLLHRLTDLDLLFLVSAAFESRTKMLSGRTPRERDEVNEYIEQLQPEDKPLVNRWRDPESHDYPTRRMLSTLRFESSEDSNPYWGMLRTACMLREYALSRMTLEQICTRWNFHDDLEGRLLPMASWLLNAIANICHGDRCYRLDFLRPRIFQLIQNLAVGGGLGRLFSVKGIGVRSIDKIRASGIRSFEDLLVAPSTVFHGVGLTRRQVADLGRLVARAGR
jgi:replicative superfamily II helicase